ncbi:hypothetical protein GCM10027037_12090 [Mucilaginibacter koreensis]
MRHQSLISSDATAEEGKKYAIIENHQFNIGEATFLNKDGDKFVFEINLSGNRKPENYEYMYDVDSDTQELIGLRAKIAVKE